MAAFSLDPAALPAPAGLGEDVASGDLVPPFLLCRGPNLFLTAVATRERFVLIIAALHKFGAAPTIVGSETGVVDQRPAVVRARDVSSLPLGFPFGGAEAMRLHRVGISSRRRTSEWWLAGGGSHGGRPFPHR